MNGYELWAYLLLDFSATNPTKEQRHDFGMECYHTCHLPLVQRVKILREKFNLPEAR